MLPKSRNGLVVMSRCNSGGSSRQSDAKCSLDYRNAYELLVATILSAQCTDVRVNIVTPALFERFPDAPAIAEGDPEDLETRIKSTGFFRNKTKSLLGMARAVVDKHRGAVPSTMDELTKLPGVGRKTANRDPRQRVRLNRRRRRARDRCVVRARTRRARPIR